MNRSVFARLVYIFYVHCQWQARMRQPESMACAMILQLEIGLDIPVSTSGLVARALVFLVSTSGLVARALDAYLT